MLYGMKHNAGAGATPALQVTPGTARHVTF